MDTNKDFTEISINLLSCKSDNRPLAHQNVQFTKVNDPKVQFILLMSVLEQIKSWNLIEISQNIFLNDVTQLVYNSDPYPVLKPTDR